MSGIPLVVFGTLVLGCLAVGGYVLHQRSQQTTAQEVQKTKTSSSASSFASELAGNAPAGGVVPAATVPQVPDLPASTPKEENRQSPAPSAPVPVSVATPPVPPSPWQEHASRLNDTRFAALESALKTRTGVLQGHAQPPASQLGNVQTQLATARQQTTDPTAAYQKRLEALRGTLGSGTAGSPVPFGDESVRGNSGQNEITQFTRSSWALPNELETLSSPYTLQAGFIIPAIMISGISSNLPGQVMAQVSQNVYDSPTGKFVLIPQGTRLVGTYSSDVGYGQERVLMAWQRLLFPDGRTLDIQAMPGADAGGKAGFTDKVNTHFWRTFSSAFLLSGIVAAVSLSQGDRMAQSSSDSQRASDALSEALGQNLGTAMAETIRKNLNIAPTLEIRPGYRFNVMVTKDMAFPGPYAK